MPDPANHPKEHGEGEGSFPPVVYGPIEVEDDDPAQETPRPLPLPYKRRMAPPPMEPSSRELMLGWCIWLLATWAMLGLGLNGRPLRAMVVASSIGMMLIWPVFRLSQHGRRQSSVPSPEPMPEPASERPSESDQSHEPDESPSHQPLDQINPTPPITPQLVSPIRIAPTSSALPPPLIFRDWFALNSVFQAILWPNVLSQQWTWDQAAWVSVSVGVWSLLIAAMVAFGCMAASGLRRTLAMGLILFLMFGEPALLGLLHQFVHDGSDAALNWQMHISPLGPLYALADRPVNFDPTHWRWPVLCVLTAAIMSWLGVVLADKRR